DGSDEAIAALRAREAELGSAVQAAARNLTARRTKAAATLARAATDELVHLAMGKARLTVSVTPLPELGPDGGDHVELLLAARTGAPDIPVSRGASGGELSRIMLA